MPGPMEGPTEWMCVLLDKSKKENIMGTLKGSYMKLKVSIAKARPEYYVNDIIGEYLNRSTLVTLARYVSGSELLESLTQGSKFDPGDTSTRDTSAGAMLGADVHDGIAMESL
ncbi:uncharacterized protein N7500_001569 [Penicillium coprophilum]|uniref:uncharacterized protein n=1 Tax=Penicillium coprophilum TaxID=36646 RepID=UPI002391B306|nr:uncharacterized protein N7500_001569 [Penicillium coprophilum]KAJ5173638.1 hypothetical protein N7500_001569 [Penicillium coprophilum]